MSDQPKRTYCVSIPIAGRADFLVDAIDEEAAIAAAWVVVESGEEADVLEWDYLEKITTGNVCHAPLKKIAVTRG